MATAKPRKTALWPQRRPARRHVVSIQTFIISLALRTEFPLLATAEARTRWRDSDWVARVVGHREDDHARHFSLEIKKTLQAQLLSSSYSFGRSFTVPY